MRTEWGLRGILVALLFFLPALPVCAATYYVAPSGSDSSAGSAAAPWATFGKAWAVMEPGDTLVVKNGTYNESIAPTISGTAASPITIMAENAGSAIIDMRNAGAGIEIYQRSYLTVGGFLVINPGEAPAVAVSAADGDFTSSHHITLRRIGARGGSNLYNAGAAIEIGRSQNCLVEDSYAYGYGRYVLSAYGSQNITMRRVVARWDRWDGTNYKPCDPKFNMGVYDTHDSTFENIILIDGGTASCGDHGALLVPGNDNGNTAPFTDSDNNKFLGMIILNNNGVAFNVEGGSGGTNDNNQFLNVVSWGNSFGADTAHKASNTQFRHILVGQSTDAGSYFGGSDNNVSGTAVHDSVFVANADVGLNDSSVDEDYNIAYGNGTNFSSGPGAHDLVTDPQLKYVTRVEANTPGKGTASDGGDRGANVLYQYVGGALTTAALWPWPYEDRIKADMCESSFLASVGRTGSNAAQWCASGKSLTRYIWEAAGNPIPPEIYGDGSPAPAPPTNVRIR